MCRLRGGLRGFWGGCGWGLDACCRWAKEDVCSCSFVNTISQPPACVNHPGKEVAQPHAMPRLRSASARCLHCRLFNNTNFTERADDKLFDASKYWPRICLLVSGQEGPCMSTESSLRSFKSCRKSFSWLRTLSRQF